MPRISVKAHHKQYLELIAQQMGVDVTEALNYLLFELRRQNFSFSSSLATSSAPMPPQLIGEFVPYREVSPATAPTAPTMPTTPTTPTIEPEPDEIVLKFAQLLEEF